MDKGAVELRLCGFNLSVEILKVQAFLRLVCRLFFIMFQSLSRDSEGSSIPRHFRN